MKEITVMGRGHLDLLKRDAVTIQVGGSRLVVTAVRDCDGVDCSPISMGRICAGVVAFRDQHGTSIPECHLAVGSTLAVDSGGGDR